MTISYNWLSEYLPESIAPELLSKMLTSIGLEVESLEKFETIKGGLEGLLIGEVLSVSPHPNADKLKVTSVHIGEELPLQIVCGASNVAPQQKVIVAKIGATIHPLQGNPVTMRLAKIRGVESFGMICAEDEIGIGSSHEGILVMPATAELGKPAIAYFDNYEDWIFEIGLTPNRMDAMSHYGVAKDLCAYLTHHRKETKPKNPFLKNLSTVKSSSPIKVTIQNTEACQRYTGISIKGVTIAPSPSWLQQRLTAIGLRPINNVVDITNFILHESGQPLHAFDADKIIGNEIIVGNLPAGSSFVTLDEKKRVLSANDLMISNAKEGMCLAGVFGGLESGVTEQTTHLFLESAWFHNSHIRKTSLSHQLRTEAATRFEKGVDISQTLAVLQRAALMIQEIAGGEFVGEIIDVYPNPAAQTEVTISNHYLKKLSGKNYHPDAVKKILGSLGFSIVRETPDELRVAVPYSKPDISIPADIVEEILRIDGLDNIPIPSTITISPAVETLKLKESLRNKLANYLVGQGFTEILTNSITNSKYYTESQLTGTVKMINNLSEDLNVLRYSMLETGLETIAYNLNRKNQDLRLFEFGKTYAVTEAGVYEEKEHFCLYITGLDHEDGWRAKGSVQDFFKMKGLAAAIVQLMGFAQCQFQETETVGLMNLLVNKHWIGNLQSVSLQKMQAFGIKQAAQFLDIDLKALEALVADKKISYQEVNKFPVMLRDLAMVIPVTTSFQAIEKSIQKQQLAKLKKMRLFDVFESEKLGKDKKSVAINLVFSDEEKTLTDAEVDQMMAKIVTGLEKELSAEIRK